MTNDFSFAKMPKNQLIQKTRTFTEELNKLKKSTKSEERIGYVALKLLTQLLDDHIYSDGVIPSSVIKNYLLIKEPSPGLWLSTDPSIPKLRMINHDISFSYELTPPKKGFGKYALFPAKQDSELNWTFSGGEWGTDLHIEPIFGDNNVVNSTWQIGVNLRKNIPITAINLGRINRRVDLPFLKWVHYDCSKSLNVLMNPESSFSHLPREIKELIFRFVRNE